MGTFQRTMGLIFRTQDPPHFSVRPAGWAFLCLWICLTTSAPAKEKPYQFESIRIETDSLRMDFAADSIINYEIFRGLKKGMTAGVEYQVQLWENRSGWFDMVVAECGLRMKIGYDNWDRKYTVMRSDAVSRFASEKEAGRQCSRLSCFPIVRRDQIKPGRAYRILVRVVFQPMSIENVQEIKRWLSGKVEDINTKSIKPSKSPLKSAGDWLLGFVVNVSGFGNRELAAESPEFTFENGAVLLHEEK